jgi:hypothetical protein
LRRDVDFETQLGYLRAFGSFALLLLAAPNNWSSSKIDHVTRDRFTVITITIMMRINVDRKLERFANFDDNAKFESSVTDIVQHTKSSQSMNVARTLVTNLSTTVNEQRVMLVEIGAQVVTSNESLSEANEAIEVQRVEYVQGTDECLQ